MTLSQRVERRVRVEGQPVEAAGRGISSAGLQCFLLKTLIQTALLKREKELDQQASKLEERAETDLSDIDHFGRFLMVLEPNGGVS